MKAQIYADYQAAHKVDDARLSEIRSASRNQKYDGKGKKLIEFVDVLQIDQQVDGCYQLADGRMLITYISHGWMYTSFVMSKETYDEAKALRTSAPRNVYFEE